MQFLVIFQNDVSGTFSAIQEDPHAIAGTSLTDSRDTLIDFTDKHEPPSYVLPSDTESEVENEPVVNLESFSKEEIFQRFRAVERNAMKYKNKYKQVGYY